MPEQGARQEAADGGRRRRVSVGPTQIDVLLHCGEEDRFQGACQGAIPVSAGRCFLLDALLTTLFQVVQNEDMDGFPPRRCRRQLRTIIMPSYKKYTTVIMKVSRTLKSLPPSPFLL